jgi:hypothetical protein
MKTIRERFEEIWPVPEGVYWHEKHGLYLPYGDDDQLACYEWNDRLDTFTRCQETTAVSAEIIFHASNLLNYVRDKYGVIGDDFSCEHMRGIAAAMNRIKE